MAEEKGRVGLAAIMCAKAAGAKSIVAIDVNDAKFDKGLLAFLNRSFFGFFHYLRSNFGCEFR